MHAGDLREDGTSMARERVEHGFIVGADRSGTTLLRLIVNGHSQIASPAETWFLISLIDEFGPNAQLDEAQVRRALDLIASQGRAKNFSVDHQQLHDALLPRLPVSIATLFDEFIRQEIGPPPGRIWMDKTPEYVLHVDHLAALFPAAKFIGITRDGRDVYDSLRARRWRGRSVLRISRYWGACVDAASAAARQLGPDRWLAVTYEELVLDTESTTRRVCEFLAVPFEPAMVTFHDSAADHITADAARRGIHDKLSRPPAASDVARWRSQPRSIRALLFEAAAHRHLRAAGYEVRLPSAIAGLLTPGVWLEHVVVSVAARIGKLSRRVLS